MTALISALATLMLGAGVVYLIWRTAGKNAERRRARRAERNRNRFKRSDTGDKHNDLMKWR